MKKNIILKKLTHLNQCKPMDTKLMKKHLYYLLFKDEIVMHFSFFFSSSISQKCLNVSRPFYKRFRRKGDT
jgi:hypothetical protein